MRKAREPGSNPGPSENFSLKLPTQNMPNGYSEKLNFLLLISPNPCIHSISAYPFINSLDTTVFSDFFGFSLSIFLPAIFLSTLFEI